MLIFGEIPKYLWYNSDGDAIAVSRYYFELFTRTFPYEILDRYGFVARSTEGVES